MLSIICIWVSIILCGVLLGMAFEAIPPVGGKGEWFYFWLIAPVMVVNAGVLAWQLGVVA